LVEHGADLNAKNNTNYTALILASENGNFEIVKYLVEKGADVNAINNNKTPLMSASRWWDIHFEMVKYLF
jgi:ankyrin repeat protein